MKFRLLIVGCLVLAGSLLGCGVEKPGVVTEDPEVAAIKLGRVDLPRNILVLDRYAAAFAVPFERLPLRICAKRINLTEWIKNYGPAKSYQLHLVGDEGTSLVDYRRLGDEIVADLIPGRTYLIAETPKTRVRNTYRLLERVNTRLGQIDGVRPDIYEDLCRYILCAPDMMPATRLAEKFPELRGSAGDLGLAHEYIGGWSGNICEQCVGGPRPPSTSEPDEGGFLPERQDPDFAACAGPEWTVVFAADLQNESVGTAPSSSPPTGSISLGGPSGFAVVDDPVFASRAVQVERPAQPDASVMNCEIQGDAIATGGACVKFCVRDTEESLSDVVISLLSSDGQAIIRLIYTGSGVFGTNGYILVEPSGHHRELGYWLDLPDIGQFVWAFQRVPHDAKQIVQFLVDMNTRTFDLFIDGRQIVFGEPFLAVDCPDLASLRFETVPAVLEALPVELYLDDIWVSRD